MKRIFFLALFCLLAFTSCGDDNKQTKPETIKDRLEKIEGRALTSTEVDEQIENAKFVCQLKNDLLVSMWADMNEKQLDFQDFVFEVQCKEKANFYSENTNRLLAT